MLGETLGAIPALEQESLARRRPPKRPLELARLAGKNQRWIARKLTLGFRERLGSCRWRLRDGLGRQLSGSNGDFASSELRLPFETALFGRNPILDKAIAEASCRFSVAIRVIRKHSQATTIA